MTSCRMVPPTVAISNLSVPVFAPRTRVNGASTALGGSPLSCGSASEADDLLDVELEGGTHRASPSMGPALGLRLGHDRGPQTDPAMHPHPAASDLHPSVGH
jgi:hypothetical protein